MKLTKLKPLTEKEELHIAFPNLKDITCKILFMQLQPIKN